MKSLIQKLVETPGPSGYESHVRALVRGEIESLVDDLYVDELGNLLARRGMQAANGLKIMLSAHMDEIGLIATYVEKRGFVRFLPIGPVHPLYCPGARVRFLNDSPGIIGGEPPGDSDKPVDFAHMFIDMGASSQDDCPVHSGDVAVFESSCLDMGRRLVSHAMGNRVGLAVIIETLRRIKEQGIQSPHQILVAFSTQGEMGARGANAAAYGSDPHLSLVVAIIGCEDAPRRTKMGARLGGGPAIVVRDQHMVTDPRLVSWLVDTAEDEGLPYQLEIIKNDNSTAQAILSARAGIPVGSLALPCRYINSPSEMVDYSDVQNAVRLLVALLRNPVNFD